MIKKLLILLTIFSSLHAQADDTDDADARAAKYICKIAVTQSPMEAYKKSNLYGCEVRKFSESLDPEASKVLAALEPMHSVDEAKEICTLIAKYYSTQKECKLDRGLQN